MACLDANVHVPAAQLLSFSKRCLLSVGTGERLPPDVQAAVEDLAEATARDRKRQDTLRATQTQRHAGASRTRYEADAMNSRAQTSVELNWFDIAAIRTAEQ